EAAAQAALGGHDDEQVRLIPAGAHQQLRRVLGIGAPAEIAEHGVHALRIRAGGGGCLLGAAQLGCGDHLHRLGDLPRRLDRGDAVAEVFETWHCASACTALTSALCPERGEGTCGAPSRYAVKFLAKASRAATSFFS